MMMLMLMMSLTILMMVLMTKGIRQEDAQNFVGLCSWNPGGFDRTFGREWAANAMQHRGDKKPNTNDKEDAQNCVTMVKKWHLISR